MWRVLNITLWRVGLLRFRHRIRTRWVVRRIGKETTQKELIMKSALLSTLLVASASAELLIVPGAEYTPSSYDSLRSDLDAVSSKKGHIIESFTGPQSSLCFAHSKDGAKNLLDIASSDATKCSQVTWCTSYYLINELNHGGFVFLFLSHEFFLPCRD